MKRKFFILLFLLGLLISIYLHVLAYTKDYSQLSSTPYLIISLIGLLLGLSWLMTKNSVEIKGIQKKYKICFYITFFIIFIYGFFVSYKADLFKDGTVSIENGKKVIINHGTILRELSDSEYKTLRTWLFRQRSIFCIVWYLGLLGFACFFNNEVNSDIEKIGKSGTVHTKK